MKINQRSTEVSQNSQALLQQAKMVSDANRYAFLRKTAAKRAVKQALKRR